MSMGSPQMVSEGAPNRRKVRNSRRWRKWREDAGTLSHLIKQDSRTAVLSNLVDEQHQEHRRQAMRRIRVNRRRLALHYCKLLPVAVVTGASSLLALPIDAWDRWMTADLNRN